MALTLGGTLLVDGFISTDYVFLSFFSWWVQGGGYPSYGPGAPIGHGIQQQRYALTPSGGPVQQVRRWVWKNKQKRGNTHNATFYLAFFIDVFLLLLILSIGRWPNPILRDYSHGLITSLFLLCSRREKRWITIGVFPFTWEWGKCYWQCHLVARGLSDKM